MGSTFGKWIRGAVLASALVFPAITLGFQGYAFAQACYKTTIQSPTPFMGNSGEIVKLADGSLWEVMYSFEYLYEYYPSVIICPKIGKLNIDDKSIDVRPLSDQSTIESRIISKFEGLKAGNIYKLANGQVWQQIEPWIWIWIWVNPEVTIYADSGTYKMKVENIDHAVFVRQLK